MPAAHRRLRQLGGHVAAAGDVAAVDAASTGGLEELPGQEGSALKLLDD